MPRPPAAGVEGPLVPSTLACFLCDLQSGFGQSQYQASSHCWFAQCLSEQRGHRTWWLHSGAKESTWVWELSFAKWVCLVLYIYIYTYIYICIQLYTSNIFHHMFPTFSNILQHIHQMQCSAIRPVPGCIPGCIPFRTPVPSSPTRINSKIFLNVSATKRQATTKQKYVPERYSRKEN